MTTTSTDPIIAGQRRWGASWAGKTPAEVATLVLENRAKFGALQDELNRACREAGRVFTGPAADALAEICQGLDSLYIELTRRPDQRATVRESVVAWSEPSPRGPATVPVCLACGRSFQCQHDLAGPYDDQA